MSNPNLSSSSFPSDRSPESASDRFPGAASSAQQARSGSTSWDRDPSRSVGAHDDDALARVVEGAHETVDRLAETVAPHVQRLQEGATELRHTGEEWAEGLRTAVRKNPLTSLAAAFAVGAVVARLTSSGRRGR